MKFNIIQAVLAALAVLPFLVTGASGQEYDGRLELEVNRQFLRSGDQVVLQIAVRDLTRPVKACQAFLSLDSWYLAVLDIQEGGAQWDDLIYSHYDALSLIDTAVGVYGETVYGSQADGVVASILLQAGPHEGTTRVIFRPDGSDVESTFLADMDAAELWPEKIDSPLIVIDNTAPDLAIIGVEQWGESLIDPWRRAVQGEVLIFINASDALSGLNGAPLVTVKPQSGLKEEAELVELQEDIFIFRWRVSADTNNGLAQVEVAAVDRSGNIATQNTVINVNKNRISGQIELDGFVGQSRTVVFTSTGADVRQWVIAVSEFASATAEFALDDVPSGTTGLSAKTSWHLRRKVPVLLSDQGQGTAEFIGESRLLGGDLNNDNIINVLDYTVLRQYWFTTQQVADITGSGVVNGNDYTLMKLNWMIMGDAP